MVLKCCPQSWKKFQWFDSIGANACCMTFNLCNMSSTFVINNCFWPWQSCTHLSWMLSKHTNTVNILQPAAYAWESLISVSHSRYLVILITIISVHKRLFSSLKVLWLAGITVTIFSRFRWAKHLEEWLKYEFGIWNLCLFLALLNISGPVWPNSKPKLFVAQPSL